jgi:hypothetical protein
MGGHVAGTAEGRYGPMERRHLVDSGVNGRMIVKLVL